MGHGGLVWGMGLTGDNLRIRESQVFSIPLQTYFLIEIHATPAQGLKETEENMTYKAWPEENMTPGQNWLKNISLAGARVFHVRMLFGEQLSEINPNFIHSTPFTETEKKEREEEKIIIDLLHFDIELGKKGGWTSS